MDGTLVAAIFEKDCDCDDAELHTVDIHTDVSMNKNDFNELFENSDNDFDNEWKLVTFFIVTE